MAIGVLHKDLPDAIGSLLRAQKVYLFSAQVLGCLLDRGHPQSKVIAPGIGVYRVLAVADQVQLLYWSELKPGPREIKVRPTHLRKVQNIAVKPAAGFYIPDVQGYVV